MNNARPTFDTLTRFGTPEFVVVRRPLTYRGEVFNVGDRFIPDAKLPQRTRQFYDQRLIAPAAAQLQGSLSEPTMPSGIVSSGQTAATTQPNKSKKKWTPQKAAGHTRIPDLQPV